MQLVSFHLYFCYSWNKWRKTPQTHHTKPKAIKHLLHTQFFCRGQTFRTKSLNVSQKCKISNTQSQGSQDLFKIQIKIPVSTYPCQHEPHLQSSRFRSINHQFATFLVFQWSFCTMLRCLFSQPPEFNNFVPTLPHPNIQKKNLFVKRFASFYTPASTLH